MSHPGQTASTYRIGTGLVLTLAVAHFAAVIGRVLPSVVAADLQAAFDLDDAQFGLLHGPAFVGVYAAGLILAAGVVDRVDRYRLMAVCIVVWTLASLACAAARTWEQLLVARAFVGLGQAAFAPAAISLIAGYGDAGKGQGIARPLSVFSAGAALGRSGGLLLGGAVLLALAAFTPVLSEGADRWRAVYVVLVVPNLLLAAALALRSDAGRSVSRGDRRLTDSLASVWRGRAALLPHVAAASAAILLTQTATAWIPSVFQRTLGLPTAQAALLAGLIVLTCAPLGHLVGGFAVDRLSRRGSPPGHVIIAGLGVAALFGVVLGLSRSVPTAVVAYGGLSIGLGAAALAALAGLQPLVAPARRGAVNALYLAVVTLVALGLGPPLVGLLSEEAFPSRLGLGQALAVVIVITALIGAVAAALGLRAWTRLARSLTDG